jgi:hypothetical protein
MGAEGSPRRRGIVAITMLVASGCGIGGGSHLQTATVLPDEPRRPPGIAVDPTTSLPPAQPSGVTQQRVLVLTTPLDPALPRETVRRFFDAVVHEDEARLQGVLAEDASFQPGAQGARQSARSVWQARFARLPYQGLFGYTVVREASFETHAASDAPRVLSGHNLPPGAGAGDVLVRARVLRTHLAKSRLFGDEIWFFLTPREQRYEIRAMIEDFTLK